MSGYNADNEHYGELDLNYTLLQSRCDLKLQRISGTAWPQTLYCTASGIELAVTQIWRKLSLPPEPRRCAVPVSHKSGSHRAATLCSLPWQGMQYESWPCVPYLHKVCNMSHDPVFLTLTRYLCNMTLCSLPWQGMQYDPVFLTLTRYAIWPCVRFSGGWIQFFFLSSLLLPLNRRFLWITTKMKSGIRILIKSSWIIFSIGYRYRYWFCRLDIRKGKLSGQSDISCIRNVRYRYAFT